MMFGLYWSNQSKTITDTFSNFLFFTANLKKESRQFQSLLKIMPFSINNCSGEIEFLRKRDLSLDMKNRIILLKHNNNWTRVGWCMLQFFALHFCWWHFVYNFIGTIHSILIGIIYLLNCSLFVDCANH